MFADICLIWIGIQLHAPAWFYILIAIRLLINMMNCGIKLGKAVKE